MLIIGYQRLRYNFNQARIVNVRLGSHVDISVKPSKLRVPEIHTCSMFTKIAVTFPEIHRGKAYTRTYQL
jgi:hypothetical protein